MSAVAPNEPSNRLQPVPFLFIDHLLADHPVSGILRDDFAVLRVRLCQPLI
jgi:hypothetical protein